MSTTPVTTASELPDQCRLPDPPEREPDERAANFDAMHRLGSAHYLSKHFGHPESTLVTADLYITMRPERRLPSGATRRAPDLMIAFNVDPEGYRARNGYVIEEQGKAPDFVLEVASASTAADDIGPKRDDYEALGIREYWRFSENSGNRGARLSGDRLVGGVYAPVDVEELPDGAVQGYSQALDLRLRWEEGILGWFDPATDRHIPTVGSERDRAERAEARARIAEARIRELEAELRCQGGG